MSAQMMTVQECAEYLGVTPHAIYQRVHKRSIPFKKLGTSRTAPLRFRKADIDTWMTPA